MVFIKNILVATDFSEPSSVALAYGRDLARSNSARLHVIHIVDDMMLRQAPELGIFGDSLQKDANAQASRELNARLNDEDRKDLSAIAVVRPGMNRADAITAYAKANAVDLIVAGTHGRGAVQHFFMGSVAERLVRTAPCPVLTVRTHERDFIVPDAATLAASV